MRDLFKDHVVNVVENHCGARLSLELNAKLVVTCIQYVDLNPGRFLDHHLFILLLVCVIPILREVDLPCLV